MFFMFLKVEVNGKNVYLLYVYLIEYVKGMLGIKVIKWNFMKFIVDRNGEIIGCYLLNINLKELEDVILKLLG